MNNIQEIIALQNTIDKKLESITKESFAESYKDFFAKHSNVDGIIWAQYTPYFNDGEPCIFRVDDFRLIGKDFGDPDEGENYAYDYDEINVDLRKVNDEIPEMVFEYVFGDHVEIAIMRDGTISIEDYQHD